MEKKKVSGELVALNLVLIIQRELAANVETEGKVTVAKCSRSLSKGDTWPCNIKAVHFKQGALNSCRERLGMQINKENKFCKEINSCKKLILITPIQRKSGNYTKRSILQNHQLSESLK